MKFHQNVFNEIGKEFIPLSKLKSILLNPLKKCREPIAIPFHFYFPKKNERLALKRKYYVKEQSNKKK